MMKWIKCSTACGLLFFLVAGISQGLGTGNNLQVNNNLRLEYDDNIYQSNTNKTASLKVIDQLELMYNLNLDRTFLSLRYRPAFTWWENREAQREDALQHEADVVLNQVFSPRLSLSLMDTFRRGLQPELIDRNTGRTQENQDFIGNTANGTLSFLLSPKTTLDVAGRYYLLEYDNEAMSNSNYRVSTAGLSLRHQLSGQTRVSGDARYEDISYDGVDRGSQSVFVGAGLEKTISARLLGSLSGGLQVKTFNSSALSGKNSPYGNVSLTYLPTSLMRFTVGGGYALMETEIFPFANQEQLTGFASFAYDITSRLAFYLSGAATRGQYDQKWMVQAGSSTNGVVDFNGTDLILQASARMTYRLNRSNWLGIGYGYTTLSSDLREDFVRNQYDVNWTTQF